FCIQGASRWVYMFGAISGFGMPAEITQYFHDQLLRFIELHGDHPIYPIGQVWEL
ncbi:hypothetical protein KIPB_014838, partial [Kipferlia bialata]